MSFCTCNACSISFKNGQKKKNKNKDIVYTEKASNQQPCLRRQLHTSHDAAICHKSKQLTISCTHHLPHHLPRQLSNAFVCTNMPSITTGKHQDQQMLCFRVCTSNPVYKKKVEEAWTEPRTVGDWMLNGWLIGWLVWLVDTGSSTLMESPRDRTPWDLQSTANNKILDKHQVEKKSKRV